MRAILQRVSEASVRVDNHIVGQIANGWLVLLGIGQNDSDAHIEYLAEKVLNLRAFVDADQKMNLSVADVKGALLIVSQFTLYGDCRKGRRPSFTDAANPTISRDIYEKFVARIKQSGLVVETGQFQANMQVSLVNDGPVTFILDSSKVF